MADHLKWIYLRDNLKATWWADGGAPTLPRGIALRPEAVAPGLAALEAGPHFRPVAVGERGVEAL